VQISVPKRVHVIVSTHTSRHLTWVLWGLVHQEVSAASVTISCDTDDADIRKVAAEKSRRWGLPLRVVQRRHYGITRVAQVRNNGIRALTADLGEEGLGRSQLLLLDGDICLAPQAIAQHARAGDRGDLVLGYRVNLGREATATLDPDCVEPRHQPGPPDPAELREASRRHRKHLRKAFLRRLGLAAPHKPTVLGAHHSVGWERMRALNGYDETFQGWGMEDDDLARRMHRSGARAISVVREARAFHLWHEPQAQRVHESPNFQRFQLPWQPRCWHGLEDPVEQIEPVIYRFGP
jgi:hypothetical protein